MKKEIWISKIVFWFVGANIFILFSFSLPVLSQAETPTANIFKQYADSIVLVGAMDKKGNDNKIGSGFIVSSDGFIVTNYHLVHNAKRVFVKLRNNKGYTRVRVVDVDALKDIALIRVDDRGLKPVKLGNSNRVEIGERVVTIGNPLGLENSVADGLISSVRNSEEGFSLLQISVPLSKGSSGGPLFNLQGEVIGITTASFLEGQNLNFAVPINYAKKFVTRPHDVQIVRRKSETDLIERSFVKKKIPLALTDHEHFQIYVIQPHETLYGLAKRFDTTVKKIMVLNEMTNSNIHTGQTIKIPR